MAEEIGLDVPNVIRLQKKSAPRLGGDHGRLRHSLRLTRGVQYGWVRLHRARGENLESA